MRLFFALWPDEGVRTCVARAATTVPDTGGRTVPACNYHVTLEFIGSVTAAVRRHLESIAAGLSGRPFSLTLSRFGYWRGPGVIWLAPAEPPAALYQLAAQLRQACADAGLSPDDRVYRPHVTLRRKVRRQPAWPLSPRIHWQVQDFVLCESLTAPEGPHYRVLERWPLKPIEARD